jgi:hypothetical protein
MFGTSSRSSGWVAFAGWFLIVVGAVDALEGLIAVARQQYYLLAPNSNQIIVFDVKTWGWVTLIVGALIVFAGIEVLLGNAVARWFAIAIVSFSVIEQLAFVGGSGSGGGVWPLASIAFSGVALYALIVRWDEDTSTT